MQFRMRALARLLRVIATAGKLRHVASYNYVRVQPGWKMSLTMEVDSTNDDFWLSKFEILNNTVSPPCVSPNSILLQ